MALRADGGAVTGLGHVRRCLALAAAIRPWGDCQLLLAGDGAALLRASEVRWRRVEDSFPATLDAIRVTAADVLVVDSYAVSAADLAAARPHVRLLVAIDDLGSDPLEADLVVCPAGATLTADDGRHLNGPRYALLTPAFARPPRRAWATAVRRVLVAAGGAARVGTLAPLVAAVRATLPSCAIDVVLGAGDGPAALRAAVGEVAGLAVHQAPPDIRSLMLAADVAVTAGGVTALELAATATPAVAVCTADNQRANLAGLAAAGALIAAGDAGEPGLDRAVAQALASLAADPARRRALGERARQVVDGRGAARVAAAMHRRLGRVQPEPARC